MPRLRHALIIGVLAASLSAAPRAQEHPDFTGTWTVDHVDVQDTPNSNFEAGRGGFGGYGGRGGTGRRGGYGGGGYGGGRRNGGGRAEGARGNRGAGLSQGDTLRIAQTPERLIVTRNAPDGDVMTSYTLDGKEAKNRPSTEVEIKSKTKWDGVALVTDSTQTVEGPQGKISTKTREILSLSSDGQTLTSTMTSDSQFGKRTVTATLSRSH